jgi:23S rRNA (adenine2030-N6)-methyltransferase
VAKVLAAELLTQPADDAGRFAGSGLIVIRPPWQLDAALAQALPALLGLSGFGATGTTAVTWLAGEERDDR